jgi:integrase/recombinase XerD
VTHRLIDSFLETMIAERGASPKTIAAYRHDLEDMGAFLNVKDIKIEKARTDDLKSYVEMIVKNNLSAKTQSRRLSAIREFYRFLYSEGIIKKNPTDYMLSPKTQKSLPKYLSEEEVVRLIDVAQKKDRRLKVLLEVLYASGMRVSELVSLPVLSVTENTKHITIMGKGRKERIVPMNGPASKALNQWLVERELSLKKGRTSKWLFPSASKDGHLTRDGFFKSLKKLAILAGIAAARVSPHVFRHSFASHLIAHDADLRSVQKLLGHSDIATTEIYTHILEDRLKKTVEKSHPLAYSSTKGIKK